MNVARRVLIYHGRAMYHAHHQRNVRPECLGAVVIVPKYDVTRFCARNDLCAHIGDTGPSDPLASGHFVGEVFRSCPSVAVGNACLVKFPRHPFIEIPPGLLTKTSTVRPVLRHEIGAIFTEEFVGTDVFVSPSDCVTSGELLHGRVRISLR